MSKLVKIETAHDRTTETPNWVEPRLGEWYWVTEKVRWDGELKGKKKGDKYRWLGCVMKIGSNFLELHTPHSQNNGYSHTRVHFDDFFEQLELVPNASEVIQGKIGFYQAESNRLIEEVKGVAARLGLNPKHFLSGPAEADVDPHTTALATISGTADVKAYESALVEAKEKTLPDLFKQIKEANSELCRWMTATTMETQALIGPMEGTITEINGRIFNVSLYAGLTEDVKQVADGEPAALLDKLHVMQRRLYMDEEALLNYETGGMEFENIEAYDAWLARPENRDRILPFPRTLVAFRVRRNTKDRDWDGSLCGFVDIKCKENADKTTFFYIRNGEQLYRMNCEMDFPKMIFPDKSLYDPGQPMMANSRGGGRSNKMITRANYEEQAKEEAERKAQYEAKKKDDPEGRHWYHAHFNASDWQPFDSSNIYFDECIAEIEAKIKEYNRIAIIIQGLYDRSLVLHPHPPVRTWEPEGFERAIKLIFDGGTTLYHGDPPDFEAFRAKCNDIMGAFSVVTGQELFWECREAEKENERNAKSYRSHDRNQTPMKRYRPYGNPGPGRAAKFFKWNAKQRKGTFRWLRENVGWRSESGHTVCTLTVPADHLFNISGYTPGDYKQFFNDPRTREQYLKWAPMLLTAEDYHAGKIEAKEATVV